MSLLEKKTKIWKDGETTIPFICPELSFSKSKRFKLYSIYWPQKNYSAGLIKQTRTAIDLQAYRISRLIDEEEKNQSRMTKVSTKKSQEKATSFSQPKNGFSKFMPTRLSSLSRKNQQIVFRLTSTSQLSQSKLRDRHGNRANVFENQQEEVLYSTLRQQKKYRGTEKGFCTSRRINLNLPHNYYPGPGTYEIKRYLEQKNRLRKQQVKKQKEDNIQND